MIGVYTTSLYRKPAVAKGPAKKIIASESILSWHKNRRQFFLEAGFPGGIFC
jgi:hypothetical protein